jgi:hypothetical protein
MQPPAILLLLQLFMLLRLPSSYCRLHVGSRFALPAELSGEPLRWLRGLATTLTCSSMRLDLKHRYGAVGSQPPIPNAILRETRAIFIGCVPRPVGQGYGS